jgi:hypothetical protein
MYICSKLTLELLLNSLFSRLLLDDFSLGSLLGLSLGSLSRLLGLLGLCLGLFGVVCGSLCPKSVFSSGGGVSLLLNLLELLGRPPFWPAICR